jgi:hypothetical protein
VTQVGQRISGDLMAAGEHQRVQLPESRHRGDASVGYFEHAQLVRTARANRVCVEGLGQVQREGLPEPHSRLSAVTGRWDDESRAGRRKGEVDIYLQPWPRLADSLELRVAGGLECACGREGRGR